MRPARCPTHRLPRSLAPCASCVQPAPPGSGGESGAGGGEPTATAAAAASADSSGSSSGLASPAAAAAARVVHTGVLTSSRGFFVLSSAGVVAHFERSDLPRARAKAAGAWARGLPRLSASFIAPPLLAPRLQSRRTGPLLQLRPPRPH